MSYGNTTPAKGVIKTTKTIIVSDLSSRHNIYRQWWRRKAQSIVRQKPILFILFLWVDSDYSLTLHRTVTQTSHLHLQCTLPNTTSILLHVLSWQTNGKGLDYFNLVQSVRNHTSTWTLTSFNQIYCLLVTSRFVGQCCLIICLYFLGFLSL